MFVLFIFTVDISAVATFPDANLIKSSDYGTMIVF